ncbi:O-antigen polymerase [Aeromonas veronii]
MGNVIYKRNINPIIVFSLTWMFVLLLYSFKWTYVLKFNFYECISFFVIYIYAPFIFGGLFLYVFFLDKKFKKNVSLNYSDGYLLDYKKVKILLTIFVIGTLFELFYFKGVPLLWVLGGDPRGYADYGISSLHGLLNAIQLSLMLIYFHMAMNKKVSWFLFLMLNIWCVIMLSRFLIMISLVQVFFLYIAVNKITAKHFVFLFIFSVLIMSGFGFLGGIRSEIDESKLISLFEINDNYPSFLPKTFIWVYSYITTPFNNLLAWQDIDGGNYLLPSLLSGLFPSVIRTLVFSPSEIPTLVHETFNMSTGYSPILIDVGGLGIVIFNLIISGFITYKWFLIRTELSLLKYIVYLQCLFYLIFFNPFFTLPILFQLLFLSVCFKNSRKILVTN